MKALGLWRGRVDARPGGKELHWTRHAIYLDGDAIDLAVGGGRHIEEALVAVERQTIRSKGWGAAGLRHEARILDPHGGGAIGGDSENRAQEGIGNVEVAVPVLGDRIRRLETGSDDRHGVGLHVNSKQPTIGWRAVCEIEHVQALARLK